MRIYDTEFSWNGTPDSRKSTKYIIIHHRAGCGDVKSIHSGHLARGWVGIGYHFYVRRDGSIWRGRPLGSVGAHCENYNISSVGVCFEGNFETDTITDAQLRAGRELVSYLKTLYPGAEIKKHRDFGATACPGKNFPFEELKKGECQMNVEEAVEMIQAKVGLEDETIDFLLCYKYGEELVLKIANALV